MRQLILKCMKYFIFFLFLVPGAPSCDKINESPIPDVYVSFTVNLNIYNDLNVPGNAMYFPGPGIGGVIVSCLEPGIYYAFDATCTNEASRSCLVLKNEEFEHCPCLFQDFILECNCCGSQFYRIDGSLFNGPASIPLKHYNVSLMNNYTLRVYN
jgi:nitrite reductase/ring-hydroxylating ferredoxin subunit